MKKLLSYVVLSALFLPLAVLAATRDDAKELTQVYDAYQGAIRAGDLNQAVSMNSAETQRQIRALIERFLPGDDPVLMFKGQIPDSYEVEYVEWAKDGMSAQVYMVSQFPPLMEMAPISTAEAKVSFKKESGSWKIDSITVLGHRSTK